MYLTPQETAVQNALDAFWFENYTRLLTLEQRNQLAGEFAEKWIDPAKIKIDKPFIRHPATMKKNYSRIHTVADVLADFIMRVDQVAERSAEYPVVNPDKRVKRAIFDNKTLVYIHEKEGDDKPAPPNTIGMNDLPQAAKQKEEMSADELRAKLRTIKKYPEFHATTYAEEFGYEKKDVLRRIKRLDLSRVRECEVCGGGFYAYDRRQAYCDIQQNPNEKLSTCQRIAKKTNDLIRLKSII